MKKSKIVFVTLAILVILSISVILGCIYGSIEVPFKVTFDVLKSKFLNAPIDCSKPSDVFIIWELRLPRVILAFVIGGGLSISGVAMQSITRNVMAEPFILGLSSGSLAFVSVAFIALGFNIQSQWIIPTFAFAGALFALLIVIIMGGFAKNTSPSKLILIGTAISVTLNAIGQYGIYLSSTSNTSASIVSWMMGNLAGARWNNLLIPTIVSLIGLIFFFLQSRSFDLMSLGDDTAISLGTNTTMLKRFSLILVALIAGISVASCGIIGLIGFIIPHIIRFIFGTNHKPLFLLSFFFGGIFLIIMDLLSRVLLSPQEVPVGILTALCGGPYFIWILRKKAKR